MTPAETNLLHTLQQVFATKDDLEHLKEGINDKMDKVLNSNDKIVQLLVKQDTEKAATTGALKRHEEQLSKHETRLQTVEAKAGV